jgi:hypothetical protein
MPAVRTTQQEKTILTVFFSRDEFIKMFEDPNDHTNNSFLINVAHNNYYGGYDYVFLDGYYWAEEELTGGYIFFSFNEENTNKVKEILRMTNIKLFSEITNGRIDSPEIGKFLADRFEREFNNIAGDYTTYYDECLVEGLKEYIKRKFCGVLTKFKFVEIKCQLKYVTNVSNIIKLYEKYEMFDKDFLGLMNHILNEEGLALDEDLYDDYFDYFSWENFDSEGFNRNVGKELDGIIEEIEDDIDSGILEKNTQLQNLMDKLNFKYNTWYNFPKEKQRESSYKFIIKDINSGKIHVEYNSISDKSHQYFDELKMGYDDFLTFLYHPELFD